MDPQTATGSAAPRPALGPTLTLTIQDASSWRPLSNGGPAEIWTGGRVVGGTLDRLLRGKPEGSTLRCWLARTEPGSPPSGDQPDDCVAAWDLEALAPEPIAWPEDAGALFVVTMDIAPEAEGEFNDWYDTEHIPALVQVPGVLSGRRFRALRGAPRYVAIYHLVGPDSYGSDVWCAADRTPWIQRLRRYQSNRAYFMFRPGEPGRAARWDQQR